MALTPEQDKALARQARVVSLVIAAAMMCWIGVNWLGSKLEWAQSTRILFDLAAIAAFVWALVVAVQIWRKRRDG